MMTNYEYYFSEIAEENKDGDKRFAVVNGKIMPCNCVDCAMCLFNKREGACIHNIAKWLGEEYTPSPCIDVELELLKILKRDGFNYIARDKVSYNQPEGALYAYSNIPSMGSTCYEVIEGKSVFLGSVIGTHFFGFIKFQHGVFEIEELIKASLAKEDVADAHQNPGEQTENVGPKQDEANSFNLTEGQKAALVALKLGGWRYLARDEKGKLYAYARKPEKLTTVWATALGSSSEVKIYSSLLDFISWEDEEPFDINAYITDGEVKE